MRNKNSFLHSRYMGLFFMAVSIALFIVFQFYVVKIAYTKLPDGNYNEHHGMVSYFKNYIYCILAILFIGGGIHLFWPAKKQNKQIDKNEDTGSNK